MESLGEQITREEKTWKERGENVEEEHNLFRLKLLMVVKRGK